MRRTHEHSHENRRLPRALGLGLSGAALAGLIYLEGTPARAEEDVDDVADRMLAVHEVEVDDVLVYTIPEAGPVDARRAMATTAGATAAMPVLTTASTLVVVPDLEGMGLRKAKQELAAVGLKLSVRDEYGDKIPAESWSGYKVGTQKVEAGAEVEPGSTVKVKARMRRNYAMGY